MMTNEELINKIAELEERINELEERVSGNEIDIKEVEGHEEWCADETVKLWTEIGEIKLKFKSKCEYLEGTIDAIREDVNDLYDD